MSASLGPGEIERRGAEAVSGGIIFSILSRKQYPCTERRKCRLAATMYQLRPVAAVFRNSISRWRSTTKATGHSRPQDGSRHNEYLLGFGILYFAPGRVSAHIDIAAAGVEWII